MYIYVLYHSIFNQFMNPTSATINQQGSNLPQVLIIGSPASQDCQQGQHKAPGSEDGRMGISPAIQWEISRILKWRSCTI